MELMTLHRLEQRLENERQRYVRQQEREELLSRRMQRTRQNIENLEYALQSLERIISLHRRHRVIPHAEIDSFFDRASAVYERLHARLHLNLSYSFFCYIISTRYLFESRVRLPNRRFLGFTTVFSYFKKKRGS